MSQLSKAEEKRLLKKITCQANRPTTPFTCSKCGRDELVFTITTDAAKWVQIYGLLRPTDANDIYILGSKS